MVALKEMRICDLYIGRFGQYYFSPLYRGVAGLPDRAFFFFLGALRKIATKISTRLRSRSMVVDLSSDHWTVKHTCKKLWALEILIGM